MLVARGNDKVKGASTATEGMYDSLLIRTSLVLLSYNWITKSEAAVSVLNGIHYALEGKKTSINCSITGEAFQGWFDSNGQKISDDPSQRQHVRNNGSLQFLEITRVNKTDIGQYECRGETNKSRVMLYVEYRPVLIRERSSPKKIFSTLDNNEEVTLNCVFDGFPVPRVRFHKFGEELNNSGITYGSGSASYKFSLKSQSDFAFYTCKAENSRGNAVYYIEVHERGPPEPPNNIRVSPKCNQIDVTWLPAVNDGGSSVIGYNIELWREGKTLQSESLPISSRTKSFKDLEAKTLYEVRMNSKNAIGEGEWRIIPVNTTMACSSQALSSAASECSFFFAWIISAVHIIL